MAWRGAAWLGAARRGVAVWPEGADVMRRSGEGPGGECHGFVGAGAITRRTASPSRRSSCHAFSTGSAHPTHPPTHPPTASAPLHHQRASLSDGALVGFSRRFPKLHTLCLYRNMFGDLSDALACVRQLPKLRELDLDGNGAATASGYRHHVVRALGRLESLDGEPVSELDRDLADHFFSNAGGGAAGNANRPSTAPDGGRRARPGAGLSVDGGAAGAGGGADASTTEFDWSELPKGDVRLVGSKGLNSNPVMVTYVAEQLLANPTSSASDDLSALRRLHEEKDESAKKAKEAQMQPRPPPGSSLTADRSPQRQRPSTAAARSGDNFVHRLRRSAEVHQDGTEGGGGSGSVDILTLEGSPVRPAAGAADAHPGSPFDVAEDADAVDSYGHAKLGGSVAEALAGEEADAVRARAGAGAGPALAGRITGGASGADLSDPYAIIRRLVKMVEVLKQERDDANDSARAAGVGDDGRASKDITMLQRELTEMRIENANMFVLQEENRQLKEQAEKVTLDMDELKLLREENKELQVQLNDASQQLQALHLSHMLAPSGSAAGSAMQTAMHSAVYDAMPGLSHGRSLYQDPGVARPQTAAEVLDDAEDEMDAEVAALFARNEHTLKQLREDVKVHACSAHVVLRACILPHPLSPTVVPSTTVRHLPDYLPYRLPDHPPTLLRLSPPPPSPHALPPTRRSSRRWSTRSNTTARRPMRLRQRRKAPPAPAPRTTWPRRRRAARSRPRRRPPGRRKARRARPNGPNRRSARSRRRTSGRDRGRRPP